MYVYVISDHSECGLAADPEELFQSQLHSLDELGGQSRPTHRLWVPACWPQCRSAQQLSLSSRPGSSLRCTMLM